MQQQKITFVCIQVLNWPSSYITRYTKEGSFWEDMIPYFKKRGSTDKYFTVHPNANIQFYYVPWVVSDRAVDPVNDLSHISLKTQVRHNKHKKYG